MPPQVGGPGRGPIARQEATEVEEVKSNESEKKLPGDHKEGSTGTTGQYRASQKETANRKAELAAGGISQQTALKLAHEKSYAKSTLKAPEGTLWDSAKSAARFASDTAKAGASTLGNTTAKASGAILLDNANQRVKDGYLKALTQKGKELGVSASGPLLAEKANQQVREGYSQALIMKGKDLAAEVKRVGSGNASFEEKEQLIHGIDAYRREVTDAELFQSGLYAQETQNPPRMVEKEIMGVSIQLKSQFQEDYSDRQKGGLTELLGPYGYHDTLIQGNQMIDTKAEILDASLHNWRSTPKEIRQKVDSGEIHPIKLSDSKYWKTPPDTRLADRAAEGGQLITENSGEPAWHQGKKFNLDSPGISPYPFNGQAKDRPDYDKAAEQYKHDFTQGGLDVVNSYGLTHGAPTLESPGTNIIEGPRASAPERNLAETQPGPARATTPHNQVTIEPSTTTKTQQPLAESVEQKPVDSPQLQSKRKAEPDPMKQSSQEVRDEVAKRETNEAKIVKSDQMSKPSRKLAEVSRDLGATQREMESLVADIENTGLRDVIREGLDGMELRGTRKQKAHEVEHILNRIVQRGGRRDASSRDVRNAEAARDYVRQIRDLSSRLDELNKERARAKLTELNEEYAKTR